MRLLIKDCRAFGPGQDGKTRLNCLIEEGVISYMGRETPEADRTLSSKDLCISPGWVDMNCSLPEPGHEERDDMDSIEAAALMGGFTHLLCQPDTSPIIQSKSIVRYVVNGSVGRTIDFHPMAAISKDLLGQELTEMLDLQRAGALAFTDGDMAVTDMTLVSTALLYLQQIDGLLVIRPQDLGLGRDGLMHEGKVSTMLGLRGIPAIAEEMAIARVLQVLRQVGGRVHFTKLSTREGLEIIVKAKKNGQQVSCDMAALQCSFTDEDMMGFDTNLKALPPYREANTAQYLLKALKEGRIDAVVSDHRPFDPESKQIEFDLASFGAETLETAFAAINTALEGGGTAALINALSTGPRKLLGFPDGELHEGAAADITLFDPTLRWTYDESLVKSRSYNSPFIGKELLGKVLGVCNKGNCELQEAFLKIEESEE